MRSIFFFTLLFLFVLALDLYAFRGMQHLGFIQPDRQKIVTLVYWGLTFLMVCLLVRAGTLYQHRRDPGRFFVIMLIFGIFLMLYVPKIFFNIFQLVSDVTLLTARIFNADILHIRKYFLITGTIGGIVLFSSFGMGMLRGRTHLKVFREEIIIGELPGSLSGLAIVQLSDLHLAGFYNNRGYIRHVVDQVNRLQPDLILFTGDMVHHFAEEVDPFVDLLNELKATKGKFAVLGNHDYGQYYAWKTKEDEVANLDRVKEQIRASGFDLLLNEHRTITLNGDFLEIIGVENWGKPPFQQYGDLARAMEGTDPSYVKILMSHDPSHWELEVRERGRESEREIERGNIQLTLSGHTHGMQFGIELGKFKWSPSRWRYKYWAGHYQENGRHLYVNRGLGFTGFPGRVGIRPEITLLTLKDH